VKTLKKKGGEKDTLQGEKTSTEFVERRNQFGGIISRSGEGRAFMREGRGVERKTSSQREKAIVRQKNEGIKGKIRGLRNYLPARAFL